MLHSMTRNTPDSRNNPEGAELPPDPYASAAVDEAELWFLPGPGAPLFDLPSDLPAGRAPAKAEDWLAQQGSCAAALADLSEILGALSDRLTRAPEGWARRLALAEASALGWWAGDRVAPERLALEDAGHLAGPRADAQALARLGWAVRRLSGGGPDPREDLATFLGRIWENSAGTEPLLPETLHPVVGAARAFGTWRGGSAGPSGPLEAAVLAARLGAPRSRPGLSFLPLARGGAEALTAGGSPAARLPRWIAGARRAALAALMDLDRVADWQARAAAGTADLSGRTMPRLIAALAAHPLVSAPAAEAATGASRAAVQRNLARLEARGLVREVTGQGRYRLWTAAM